MAAKVAKITITSNNSINVNACSPRRIVFRIGSFLFIRPYLVDSLDIFLKREDREHHPDEHRANEPGDEKQHQRLRQRD